MIDDKYLTFIVVANEGSFSRAAEMLYMSAVAVRKQMNVLEKELDLQLFKRTSQGVKLTDAGEILLEGIQTVKGASEQVFERLSNYRNSLKKTIRIGMSLMRPGTPLIEIWQQKNQQLSGFNLQITAFDDAEVNLSSPSARLGKDFDIIVGPNDGIRWQESIQTKVLGFENFLLAAPKNHRLAEKRVLSFDDLKNETVLLPPRNESPNIELISRDLEENHPEINLVATDNFFTPNIYNDYANQDYLVFIRETWRYLSPGMIVIPVEWDYKGPYGVMYSREPRQAVVEFVALITQE